ncbi:MAG TPA: SHOCT domain-containing protein [Actinocrinis sp.]
MQQRGADQPSDNNPFEQQPFSFGGRESATAGSADALAQLGQLHAQGLLSDEQFEAARANLSDSQSMPRPGQAVAGQPFEPNQQSYGQQPPFQTSFGQPFRPPAPPKKNSAPKILGFGCLGLVALVVVIVVASALASSGKTGTGSVAAGASASAPAAAGSDAAVAPASAASAAAPASSAAQVAPTVAYSCTGSAPDGVNITYGPEGTNDSASSLPFSASQPLTASALYVTVTAQLQGSGQVSCTTTVTYGAGQTVTQTGNASGGYNIASAEVCSDFTDGWRAC